MTPCARRPCGSSPSCPRHEAVPRLEELLTAQENADGRPQNGRPGAARARLPRAARNVSSAFISDWHVETATRSSLASAVGELGEESALDLVVEALTNARLPSSVRTGLALSFKGFEGPTAATVLIGLLQMPDLDYGVRLAVADHPGPRREGIAPHGAAEHVRRRQARGADTHPAGGGARLAGRREGRRRTGPAPGRQERPAVSPAGSGARAGHVPGGQHPPAPCST